MDFENKTTKSGSILFDILDEGFLSKKTKEEKAKIVFNCYKSKDKISSLIYEEFIKKNIVTPKFKGFYANDFSNNAIGALN